MAADAPANARETAGIVTFVELAGPDARSALAGCGARSAARGAACELLAAEEQSDLYLLVCRDGAPIEIPEGARTWRFRPLERTP